MCDYILSYVAYRRCAFSTQSEELPLKEYEDNRDYAYVQDEKWETCHSQAKLAFLIHGLARIALMKLNRNYILAPNYTCR